MRTTSLVPTLALLLLPATALAQPSPAPPAPPPLPKLVMKGPDAAVATYADKCSNGGNADEANRLKFVEHMLADPKSKLGQAKARLLKAAGADFEVRLSTPWVQTFHERNGCADIASSYSALVLVESTMGNTHELATKLLVTIDDDLAADQRSLKLRSLTPLALRTKP